jgi:hypothetical protein
MQRTFAQGANVNQYMENDADDRDDHDNLLDRDMKDN